MLLCHNNETITLEVIFHNKCEIQLKITEAQIIKCPINYISS